MRRPSQSDGQLGWHAVLLVLHRMPGDEGPAALSGLARDVPHTKRLDEVRLCCVSSPFPRHCLFVVLEHVEIDIQPRLLWPITAAISHE